MKFIFRFTYKLHINIFKNTGPLQIVIRFIFNKSVCFCVLTKTRFHARKNLDEDNFFVVTVTVTTDRVFLCDYDFCDNYEGKGGFFKIIKKYFAFNYTIIYYVAM